MLPEYHNQLKKFVFNFFKICRCDFLPNSLWGVVNVKLLLFPLHLLFGTFCVLWHLFVQIETYNDLLDLAFTVIYFFIAYQSMVVYLSLMIVNKEKIWEIFEYFDKLVWKDASEIADLRQRHLERNLNVCIMVSKGFVIPLTCMGIVVICNHLWSSNFVSPMIFTIPGIPSSSYFYRPLNITYQVIFYFTIIETAVISDVVVMIMIFYVQGEFAAITELTSMHLNCDSVPHSDVIRILRCIYRSHVDLLKHVKALTEIFWHFYFHKLLTIALYFCGILVLVQSLNGSLPIAIMTCSAMVAQLFILCYFGQILVNSSEKLSEALYQTNWYEMIVFDQKNFLLLMTNVQKSMRIDTFAFGDISIYTFVQISKVAFSYATVVYTVLN